MVKKYTYGHEFTIKEAKNLIRALMKLKDKNETEKFLQDLLTPQEIEDLSRRLEAARLLISGMTFDNVERELKMSPTTVQKIYKKLWGGKGGYLTILKRL